MRPSRNAALRLLMAVMAVVTLGGCSGDALGISCSDYLGKDAATQLDLAGRFASPTHATPGPIEKMIAPQYQQDLVTYCGSHPDDQLSDLNMTFGLR